MKVFDIWKQIYICKNIDKLSLFDIAAFVDCETQEVKDEYNRLKAANLYEQYRRVSDEDLNEMIEKAHGVGKKRGRPAKIININNNVPRKEVREEECATVRIPITEYAMLQWKSGFCEGVLRILEK